MALSWRPRTGPSRITSYNVCYTKLLRTEKVPVRYRHGKIVKSFERMIFSYGAPLYGPIDPTPVVAFFFTLLFGIMFGDVGQGLVFALFGFVLASSYNFV